MDLHHRRRDEAASHFSVVHVTSYAYADPVLRAHHQAWLLPRNFAGQRVIASSLTIEPQPLRIETSEDWFGNRTTWFELAAPHRRLTVSSHAEIARDDPGPLDLAPSPPWERTAADLATGNAPFEVQEFRFPSPLVPRLNEAEAYARLSFTPNRPLVAALRDLTRRIHRDFTFDSAATTIATPLAEVFAKRHGVCQDFAHVGIACLRAVGLAARYQSGYLETTPPKGRPRLVGADASHAWFAAWCPGLDWIEADPTNDLMPAPHVTVAWGRDFADVTPLKGVILGGGTQRLTVSVELVRL
jgi:transglutaminase-like putative cysteine protease